MMTFALKRLLVKMMEFAYRHLAGIHVNVLEVGQEKIAQSKFHLARKG